MIITWETTITARKASISHPTIPHYAAAGSMN